MSARKNISFPLKRIIGDNLDNITLLSVFKMAMKDSAIFLHYYSLNNYSFILFVKRL